MIMSEVVGGGGGGRGKQEAQLSCLLPSCPAAALPCLAQLIGRLARILYNNRGQDTGCEKEREAWEGKEGR